MKLQPLGDKVVIKVNEEEKTTATGIILPDTAKEKSVMGKVIAVGSGEIVDGKKVPLDVAEGDMVIYSKYAGSEIKVEGEEFLVLRQHDILAIVK